jgi:hypothetical protein
MRRKIPPVLNVRSRFPELSDMKVGQAIGYPVEDLRAVRAAGLYLATKSGKKFATRKGYDRDGQRNPGRCAIWREA